MRITLHRKQNGVKVYTLWKNLTTPIAQCSNYNKLLTLKQQKEKAI